MPALPSPTAALVRQGAIPEEQPTTVSSLILIYVVVFGGLMIFMTTRNRKKQSSQSQMMRSALVIGAEVRTIGGLVGTVTDLTDEYVVVETTPGVKLKFTKQSIAGVVPPEEPELEGYGSEDEAESEVDESAAAEETSVEETSAEAAPEDAKDEQKVG